MTVIGSQYLKRSQSLEEDLVSIYKTFKYRINDQIARAALAHLIEEKLRSELVKRSIMDYCVVCDETNNSPTVLQNHDLVCDVVWKTTTKEAFWFHLDNGYF